MPRRLLVLPVLALLLLLPDPGRAQDPVDLGPATGADLFAAYDAELNRLLDEADRAAAERQYGKAVSLLAEAAGRADGQVRRVSRRTYLGIREYVNSRIWNWPEEGREVYRKLTDPRAAELFETGRRTGDVAALHTVAREYALSSFGPRAMLALGSRALARGDHDIALRHFLEILRLSGEAGIPGVERSEVLARAGLAAAKLGDRLLLEELRERAAKLPPDTTVEVAGEPTALPGFLADLAASPHGSAAPPGWSTVGGSPARSGGRDGPEGPLALYWVIPVREAWEEPEPPESEGSPRLPLHPLIADGHVIVASHEEVWAAPLPEPGDTATPPRFAWHFPDNESGYLPPRVGDPPVFATAAEGLVVLPFRDPAEGLRFYDRAETLERDTLVALDLALEGYLVGQRGGCDPLFLEQFGDVCFEGAPVVENGRVYVAGTRRPGLVETWVFCFAPSGGYDVLRPVWERMVCRRASRFDYSAGFDRNRPSSLALGHGVLYVCSNDGAVGAVDAETGELLWTHAYEQAQEGHDLFTRDLKSLRTWMPGPPMLDHRLLYVTPEDSDRLLMFFRQPDLATGFVEHDRFGRDEVVLGFDPEYLLGVQDGVAFLAGSTRTPAERPLFAVKAAPAWSGSDERTGDQKRVLWRGAVEEDAPRGRGMVAGEHLYFPTRKAIYRVSVADGAVEKLVDLTDEALAARAGDRELAGNLAVSGPWLVTASESAVALFGPVPGEKDKPERDE